MAAVTLHQKDGTARGARQRQTQLVEEELNSAIVQMLEQDGRMAFSEIAQKLDVSEGTIRNRVNGMKEAGRLRIVAITDPAASEYKTDAMVGIKVAPGTKPKDVADRLGRLNSVVYILWVTGRYDLMVELVCDTADEMAGFLDQHIHGEKDIMVSETMLGLKNFKNQFLLKRNWEADG